LDHANTVLSAVHPWGLGFNKTPGGAQIQSPPAPSAFALVVLPRTLATNPAQPRLPTSQANLNDEVVAGHIHAFNNGTLDT